MMVSDKTLVVLSGTALVAAVGLETWFIFLATSWSLEMVNVTSIAGLTDSPDFADSCELLVQVHSPVDDREYFVNVYRDCCRGDSDGAQRLAQCYNQSVAELTTNPVTICRRHPADAVPPVMYKHVTVGINFSLGFGIFIMAIVCILVSMAFCCAVSNYDARPPPRYSSMS